MPGPPSPPLLSPLSSLLTQAGQKPKPRNPSPSFSHPPPPPRPQSAHPSSTPPSAPLLPSPQPSPESSCLLHFLDRLLLGAFGFVCFLFVRYFIRFFFLFYFQNTLSFEFERDGKERNGVGWQETGEGNRRKKRKDAPGKSQYNFKNPPKASPPNPCPQ